MTKQPELSPRELWCLFKPYWGSGERTRGFTVVILLIAIVLGSSAMMAWFTGVTKDFFNAIDQRNAIVFWKLSILILGVSIAMAGVMALDQWLRQWLQIRWRKSLTEDITQRWLTNNAFYRIARRQIVDNVDQRIADDGRGFVELTLELGLSFLGTLSTFCFMGYILWTMATPISLGAVTIPGYLFFVAILYGLFQVGSVHWAGHRLAPLTIDQQRVEADFRFSLAQVRESAEQIALYQGGKMEAQRLGRLFELIGINWAQLMSNYKRRVLPHFHGRFEKG